MEAVRKHLEELGRLVAEQSDAGSHPQSVLADVHSRLVRRRAPLWAHFVRPALVGAFATAISIAALLFLGTRPGSITYEVSRVREAPGGWIETENDAARLEFSEGTRISVHPGTRLRVSDSRENGATVVIERGRVGARVEHEDERRDWRFHAGPYLVQVTGTEFEASWDAATSLFELALHEGSVVVSGPNLAQDRVVQAGDILRVSALAKGEPLVNEESQVQEEPAGEAREVAKEAPGLAEPEVVEEPRAVAEQGRDTSEDSAPTTREALDQEYSPSAAPEQPEWRMALTEGRHNEAVVALSRAGGASALLEARADELWQIADAARVGGQPALAQTALLQLREHHGVREQSAYLLGKIAVDQRGAQSEAIKWFKTYLQEYPTGSLAEQALGRLVELAQGSAEGRAFAREYLKRFPGGAYVPFARSQLAP